MANVDEREAGADSGNPNAGRIDRFLRLLEAEDFVTWGDLFSEDAVQESPYAPPDFPARFVGKRQIVEHYSQLPNAFASMRYPGLRVYQTQDPRVAVAEYRGDIRLKGSDAKYDNTYITVFQFDGAGRIRLMREYFNPSVLTASGSFASGGDPRSSPAGHEPQTADREQWTRAFLATIDSRDASRIAERLAPNVRLRFGNAEPIVGRSAARASFEQTGAALRSIHHEITGVWSGNDGSQAVVSVEALVTYELKDGRRVTVPSTSTLRLDGALVADYRIFIDASPVFGPTMDQREAE